MMTVGLEEVKVEVSSLFLSTFVAVKGDDDDDDDTHGASYCSSHYYYSPSTSSSQSLDSS